MFTFESLNEMSKEIDNTAKDDMTDIQEIKIDMRKEKTERIKEYLEQMKNPYCFKYKNMGVKIEFSDNGKNLENVLKNYFISLT